MSSLVYTLYFEAGSCAELCAHRLAAQLALAVPALPPVLWDDAGFFTGLLGPSAPLLTLHSRAFIH